jgi:AraC-like DNA-binding protein
VYHLLVDGYAYIQIEGGERVALTPGDIVTCPHGDAHWLGNGQNPTLIDGAVALPGLLAQGLELVRGGGGGAPSRFICGFLACEPQLCEMFMGGLPPILKVNIRDDPSGQWLENSLRFSVGEAAAARAGADAMLIKLSEVVFVETLRRYVRDLPVEQTGWLAGARDPIVGKSLTLMHRRPDHAWTISELAGDVGVSRSVLADRFGKLLGEPPITYLTRWRLRLGAHALATTNQSVAEIAGTVGYESEAAFNRAFKREFSLPPARYRQTERSRRRPPAVEARDAQHV